jgi:hypothetical protein
MITGKIEGSFEQSYEALFRLETCTDYVGPLLNAWSEVLVEDNRRGVMQGLQGDGSPMQPTKYRLSLKQTAPGTPGDLFFNAQGEAFNNYEAGGKFFFGSLGGNGPGYKPSIDDNLSTRAYKKLTGPPLAPRGPASRVISNYRINILTGQNRAGVEGGWDDVLSAKGVPFLPFHFNGATFSRAIFATSLAGSNQHLPRRNLVGLRQWGKSQATKELNAWIKWLLTVSQPEYFGRTRAGHNPKYVRRKRS